MKNLPLNNYVYKELELDFKEWLSLLGYSENTVYNCRCTCMSSFIG
jgi:hypothetical protein